MTVCRRISDIPDNLSQHLIEKLHNKCFALQVDEATAIHKDAHLIEYVRFVDECNMQEELFLCEPILKTATAQSLFDMNNAFFNENGICTDGAHSTSGFRAGLQANIKAVAPEAVWTHCMIHREALAANELSPPLHEALQMIVKTVNVNKTNHLKSRIFKMLHEEKGAEHTALFFFGGA
ncbi:zinc finger MYM-type protein 6-like [Cryptotermes secundus]|uniref:zinc finger MYM-type protein 6-like n=1 Tax=Cryptotermes secundus TaxID=105785 RepID=UPI000CD7D61E|nr:zinc finger MYM-type protein 6-like [Cryptotermes secundus]